MSERIKKKVNRQGDGIPVGLNIAASWAWRIGLIIIVSGMVLYLFRYMSLLVVPLMIAGLLAGLLYPFVSRLTRAGIPKGLSVAIVEIGFIAAVIVALSLTGRQISLGFADLWDKVQAGILTVQEWLTSGPLHLTSQQINDYVKQALAQLQNNSGRIVGGALAVGSSAGHIVAGLLLTLFSLIFFLYEGERIWLFLVGFAPGQAQPAIDGAGRHGWFSIVKYARVQIFVALVDAIGIAVGAAILGVPLVLPLGGLVFFGSFIPFVGSLITGAVVVLLALVALGFWKAVVMLAIVLFVQQFESHVLQPLVMGKAVSLHPLAVVLAVTAGSFVAGIPGAIFAVPVLAFLNSVVHYLANHAWETDPAVAVSLAKREMLGEKESSDRRRQVSRSRLASRRTNKKVSDRQWHG